MRLVFDIDEVEYSLDKVFSRKRDGLATLCASNGQRWEGPQAEEYLAERLDFAYAPRGASKAEHQGLAGVLWVEQARAFEEVELNDHSRRQLHAVFDAQMSELLGGEHGKVLHRRVAALRSVYFDKRGNPRGEYRQLKDSKAKLADELEQARMELEEYGVKADRLEKLQASLRGFREERIVETAQDKLHDACAVFAQVKALEEQILAARDKLALTKADQEAARLKWQARVKLIEDRKAVQGQVEAQQRRLASKEIELDPAKKSEHESKQRIIKAKEKRSSKEAQLRRARDAEQLARFKTELEALKSNLRDASAAEQAKRNCQAQYDAIAVSKEMVAELRRDRMKAILYQAAKRYQILVLTCHAKEYRDCGGKFIDLSACKAQSLKSNRHA